MAGRHLKKLILLILTSIKSNCLLLRDLNANFFRIQKKKKIMNLYCGSAFLTWSGSHFLPFIIDTFESQIFNPT